MRNYKQMAEVKAWSKCVFFEDEIRKSFNVRHINPKGHELACGVVYHNIREFRVWKEILNTLYDGRK